MYQKNGQLSRNETVKQYLPIVIKIANLMMMRLPSNIHVDDLIQVGNIGLLEAIERYDPVHDVHFESFASQRIKGAMIDYLRSNDWVSRGVRKTQKQIAKSIHKLEHLLGSNPKDSDIANDMGVSMQTYREMLVSIEGTQLFYLEDLQDNGDGENTSLLDTHFSDTKSDPLFVLSDARLKQSLIDAITKLEDKEKYIMKMYYEEDMNLKEIATVMDLTESRISQIHAKIIIKLRSRLHNF